MNSQGSRKNTSSIRKSSSHSTMLRWNRECHQKLLGWMHMALNLGARVSLRTPRQLAIHTLRRLAQASLLSSEITKTWTTRKNETPEPSVPHKMCTTRLIRQVHPQWYLLTKRNPFESRENTFSIRTAFPYFPLYHATMKQGMWPEIARLEAHCTKSSWTLQLRDITAVWIPQTQTPGTSISVILWNKENMDNEKSETPEPSLPHKIDGLDRLTHNELCFQKNNADTMDQGNRILNFMTAFVTNFHWTMLRWKQGMSPEIAMLGAHCTVPSWTLQLVEGPPWNPPPPPPFALHFTNTVAWPHELWEELVN